MFISQVRSDRRVRKMVRQWHTDPRFRKHVLVKGGTLSILVLLSITFFIHSMISSLPSPSHDDEAIQSMLGNYERMIQNHRLRDRNVDAGDDGDDAGYGSPSDPEDVPVDSTKTVWGRSHQKGGSRDVFERTASPEDKARIRAAFDAARLPEPVTTFANDMPYDIRNCPPTPSPEYPIQWNLVNNVLKDWPADVTVMPQTIHQGLCIFNWENPEDRDKAHAYRQAERPFILQRHPELMQTVERWNTDDYLRELIGDDEQRTERSENNHFMYWKARKKWGGNKPKGWKPPTDLKSTLTYAEWKQKAEAMDQVSDAEQVSKEHWYFRLNGDFVRGRNEYLYDELPIFRPDVGSNLFMVDPEEQRGINCRFGMKGVMAECHYDSSRNWIVLMGGQRRYILAHTDQCRNLELYAQGHPSGRHTKINWSDPPNHGPIASAMVNEVVLQAADALYLPTFWFHHIISLNENYQCNARSGVTLDMRHHIAKCGFGAG